MGMLPAIFGISASNLMQRGTCIKGLFWPPLKPKIENCFSPISFDWFIRRITKCKISAFI